MKTSDKLWNNTKAASIFNIFTGEIGQMLEETSPQALLRAEKYLPYIFWRWYFMIMELEKYTPFTILQITRVMEHWPNEGEFFPWAYINYKGGDIDISVQLDYIQFDRQPLLHDVYNKRKNKPHTYHFEPAYTEYIEQISPNSGDKYSSDILVSLFFDYLLKKWFNSGSIIPRAFSGLEEWKSFWINKIKSVMATIYFDTVGIVDPFMIKMRETFPGYGTTNDELQKGLKDEDRRLETYDFWAGFMEYFVVPLSLYTHLLAPTFTRRENFFEDVGELLEGESIGVLFSPCTFLSVTPFGNTVFKRLWH